jgi:uncharacterized protein (TIGR03435 family)
MRGPIVRGGRFEVRTASMVDLISKAYGVESNAVLGGPSWLEWDRFDITAKYSPDSTAESRKIMLQNLLADRFKLVVHKDTKPLPAWAVTAGKHLSLRKSDGSGQTGCKFIPPERPAGAADGAAPPEQFFAYACCNMTMAAFAEGFRNLNMAWLLVGDDPVVDQTGLSGPWDFDFKFSPRNLRANPAELITLKDALEKQAGLKIDPVSVPMPVLIVDSANRKPTDNPPGVAETLKIGPAKAEFDVADVQPTPADYRGINLDIKPGGRVNIQGVTLKFLIEQTWNSPTICWWVRRNGWIATAGISSPRPARH